MDIAFEEAAPTATEYKDLRRLAGWGHISEAVAQAAVHATALSLCARHSGELVGLGRVVGDGVLYFYISDIFVHPSQRGQRLGEALIDQLLARVREMAEPGATVAVLSAPDRETFYERAGFQRCPNAVFGAGLAYLEPIDRLTAPTP